VASDPAVANTVNERPADQPVGIGLATLEVIAPHVDLDNEALRVLS
jgi:hypothetical protein